MLQLSVSRAHRDKMGSIENSPLHEAHGRKKVRRYPTKHYKALCAWRKWHKSYEISSSVGRSIMVWAKIPGRNLGALGELLFAGWIWETARNANLLSEGEKRGRKKSFNHSNWDASYVSDPKAEFNCSISPISYQFQLERFTATTFFPAGISSKAARSCSIYKEEWNCTYSGPVHERLAISPANRENGRGPKFKTFVKEGSSNFMGKSPLLPLLGSLQISPDNSSILSIWLL